jgi:hypothetical protein
MIPTKRYHVVAMHRIDGMVLLGEFDSAAERDDLYRRERAVWLDGGMDEDVKDIVRGEMGTRERTAEEANVANALMAQMQLM